MTQRVGARRRRGLPLLAAALLAACAPAIHRAPPPPGWQAELARRDAVVASHAFPLPPSRLERLMRDARLEIRRAEDAGGGIMGARRLEAYVPAADRTLAFKWKRAPDGGEGWNNTPRREVAAYRIQQWFLPPEAYVVPTTVARCIPLAAYAPIDADAEPNLDEGRCVLGTLAIWLDDVESPEVLLDEARFYSDALYARSSAEYNLLTVLIGNRDTLVGNQLVSTDPDAPRIYSVDNSISFRHELYNFFQPHWDQLRVPALPRDSVERLRAVDAGDVDALSVVAELWLDADGVFREVEPSAPFDAEHGVRLRDGVLQLGLEPGEIAALKRRLVALLDAVDRGEIPTY